jgi:hypothetical protein
VERLCFVKIVMSVLMVMLDRSFSAMADCFARKHFRAHRDRNRRRCRRLRLRMPMPVIVILKVFEYVADVQEGVAI